MYVGGDFSILAGVTRQGAGSINTVLGIANAFNAKTSGVLAIGKSGSNIIIGGSFVGVNATSAGSRGWGLDKTSGEPISGFPIVYLPQKTSGH